MAVVKRRVGYDKHAVARSIPNNGGRQEDTNGSHISILERKVIYEHWISQIPAGTKEISVKTGIVDVEIKTQSGPGEIAPGYEDVLKGGFNGN